LISVRKAHPALSGGSYDNPQSTASMMSFVRTGGGEKVLVAINYGTSAAVASFTGLTGGAAVSAAWPASGTGGVVSGTGTFSASVPAQSFVVYSLPN